jgi:hypothetical protein
MTSPSDHGGARRPPPRPVTRSADDDHRAARSPATREAIIGLRARRSRGARGSLLLGLAGGGAHLLPFLGLVEPVAVAIDGHDVRAVDEPVTTYSGSPPRAWGRRNPSMHPKWSLRFTPTCVGTTLRHQRRRVRPSVHPHVRGDDTAEQVWAAIAHGSPPRAWGRVRCGLPRGEIHRLSERASNPVARVRVSACAPRSSS